MSLALAMALHELATNAVKYGALSNKTGTIEVSWKVQNGAAPPRLTLRWTEAGGPPVVAPRRRGFGSRLIERSLAHDLDGQVEIAFAPTGVVCTVDAPVRRSRAFHGCMVGLPCGLWAQKSFAVLFFLHRPPP